ncbi:MAG: phosphoenolpyruvate--protein phosphotransferase [Firmicutes bacterium]|nr:phosphoenolpyruvate--protein phosphotransferase [Bacillota bacterium]
MLFKGIAAAGGVATGKALIWADSRFVQPPALSPEDIQGELDRFEAAIRQTRQQLEALHQKLEKEVGRKEAEVFTAHLLFLEDPALVGRVRQEAANQRKKIEAVLPEVIRELAGKLAAVNDPYLQARAADVEDVGRRLLRALAVADGAVLTSGWDELASSVEPRVVVAGDLGPSETVEMPREKVLALATARGGPNSHMAILARAMGIPAVVGAGEEILEAVGSHDEIIVDGDAGLVIVRPGAEELREYRQKARAAGDAAHRRAASGLERLEAVTLDGRRVDLAVNIAGASEAKAAAASGGAAGVGLFRTEFLYLGKESPPGEEEQFKVYRRVVELMAPHRVIIRTLDVGGDKAISYLGISREENPFLGWRGIRFCLEQPALFKTQLRAILRAGSFGKVGLMFPMVTAVEEVRRGKALVREAITELRAQDVPFDEEVEIGAMVETPAAAVIADVLAAEVDFLSIGTNDLTQYVTAADRGNGKVAALADHFHPAVLRLIRGVVEAAHRAGIWVGMCGEMAGDVMATPLLLGLGLDELSMALPAVLPVKQAIRATNFRQAQELAGAVPGLGTAAEVRRLLAGRQH